jgi:hypothetical protein
VLNGTVTDTVEGTLIGNFSNQSHTRETNHYSNLEELMRLERILAFDVTDGSMYTMIWTSAETFKIRKRVSRLSTICVIQPFKLLKEYPEITVTTQAPSKSSYGVACIDKATKKAYYITASKNENTTVPVGDSIHLFETDLITGEIKHFDIPNATGETLYLSTGYRTQYSNYYHSRTQSVIIHNGNIYIVPNTTVQTNDADIVNKYMWFKIPINNPSNVTVCRPVSNFWAKGYVGAMPNTIQLLDDRYLSIVNDNAHLVLNIENDTIYNIYGSDESVIDSGYISGKVLYGGFIPIIGSKYTFASVDSESETPTSSNWQTDYIYTFIRLDIPMTINNLSTPIHKTPSQTMKVTYVIREVEPEDTNTEGGETV